MENMKDCGSNEKNIFQKIGEKVKNSKPVKYLRVHGKDIAIGAGIGAAVTGGAVGISHAVKAKKAAKLEEVEPQYEPELEYDELPSETDDYLEEIEAQLASDNDPEIVHESVVSLTENEVSEE